MSPDSTEGTDRMTFQFIVSWVVLTFALGLSPLAGIAEPESKIWTHPQSDNLPTDVLGPFLSIDDGGHLVHDREGVVARVREIEEQHLGRALKAFRITVVEGEAFDQDPMKICVICDRSRCAGGLNT